MGNKLSFSSINLYSQCGEKYRRHYVLKQRSKYFHSALAFGSAVDNALNVLLISKDVEKAISEFDKKWNFQFINSKFTALADHELLVYADADFDKDLLSEEDKLKLTNRLKDLNLGSTLDEAIDRLYEFKKEFGYKSFSVEVCKFFNYLNWCSLKTKGHIMINSYNAKVLPKIKEVLAVQHKTTMLNGEGDEVVQYLDLIVKWEDGKNYLMDNKTSAREYAEDSAGTSQQLISYYHQSRDDFNLDGVGFLVMRKGILKNKIKTCKKCGVEAKAGSRVKTCDVESIEGRCHGEFSEKINPECYIQIIINTVTEAAENLILSTFDEANTGIKNQYYYKNINVCKQGSIICQFYDACWKGDESELVIELKKENTL